MFSKKQIWALLIPLMIEQVLNSLMGTADTVMVSNAGSAAISAVSLVDSINVLIIMVFSAMATGGTIVSAQYLGKGDVKTANEAGKQLVLSVTFISVVCAFIAVFFRAPLLTLIFGEVEDAVMENALKYFFITGLSYPFIGLYNAGAALFRVDGNSKLPMKISTTSNVINIVGNAVLIFVFKLGVVGAAIATLMGRVFCAVVVMYFLRMPKQTIVVRDYFSIKPNFDMIKSIMGYGIPNGIENGMFQFGKLVIQSTVSTMGTAAIAANSMTSVLELLTCHASTGIGMGMMTIVGQCVGAGKMDEAEDYIKQLVKYAFVASFCSCVVVWLLAKPVTILGGMEPDAGRLCLKMIRTVCVVKWFPWTLSFIPAYGLRSAGDVKFCMITTAITMWVCRVFIAVFLARVFGIGPQAVWIGMFCDWSTRAFIFSTRFYSGKWKKFRITKTKQKANA